MSGLSSFFKNLFRSEPPSPPTPLMTDDELHFGEQEFLALTPKQTDLIWGNGASLQQFDFVKFWKSVAYITEMVDECFVTKLQATIFLADYNHFQDYKRSITGSVYRVMRDKKYPSAFPAIESHPYFRVEEKRYKTGNVGKLIFPAVRYDMLEFSAEEMSSLRDACQECKGMKMSELNEILYADADDGTTMGFMID